MNKKKTSFRQLYDQNPESGGYIIETALDRYSDVFNEWDPAPFKRRDLDPDLLYYLLTCSSDIPVKNPLVLKFNLPAPEQNTDSEEKMWSGIKTFFNFNVEQVTADLRASRRRALSYIITAFIFLLSAFLLQPVFEKQVFLSTLLEGLFIGGWVFLWEAFATLFFRNRDTMRKLKEFKRLYNAPILFNYTENTVDKID